MRLGNVQNCCLAKNYNTPSFGAILLHPNNLKVTRDAFEKIFTTPELKQEAQDTFERINQKSGEIGKDCILKIYGPNPENGNTEIGICSAESYATSMLLKNPELEEKVGGLEFSANDEMPDSPDVVISKLRTFEEDTIKNLRTSTSIFRYSDLTLEQLNNSRSTLDGFLSCKTIVKQLS